MTLILYMHSLSQPSRAIQILLKLSGVKYEEKTVNFVTGETHTDWFSEINPIEQVPVLNDSGFQLTESVAILHYLCNRQIVSNDWYPSDVVQRARVDEFLAWQNSYGLRPNAMNTFIAQARAPFVTGNDVDEVELQRQSLLFQTSLDQMENYFLVRGDFISGKQITIADLCAVCELMQPLSVGYPATRDRTRLTLWLQRVKDKLQPQFDTAHTDLINFGEKYKRENWEKFLS